MFYTHEHSNYAVTNPLFNYVSKGIFAQLAGLEMRVTQIFLLFFHNPFFFVYQRSDLEDSCSNVTKTRHMDLVVVCRS
jgi:hypothetical protein